MASNGINSPIADQDAIAHAGSDWVKAVRDISPHLTYVRGSIKAARDGTLNVDLLKAGLQAYKDVGLEVRAVIENNLVPAPTNPNGLLGYKGDPMQNEWGQEHAARTITLLQALGPDLCPKVLQLGNEGNTQAAANPLSSGKIIPELVLGEPADPSKPEAQSPEACWAYVWHAATWIKKECPFVEVILPPALSILVKYSTSMTDKWVGGYIDAGMKYLLDNGKTAPWPFQGLSANLEGLVTDKYAAYVAYGLSHAKSAHQITGPTVIGEWGVPFGTPQKPVDEQATEAAFSALNKTFDYVAFFAAQVSGGYGALNYSFSQGEFIPGHPTDWKMRLAKYLGG